MRTSLEGLSSLASPARRSSHHCDWRVAQVATRVYTRLGVNLIGLELRSPVSGATRILLNPSGMLVPDVFLYAVQGIVLADSVEEASLLSRGNFSSVKTLRSVEVGHCEWGTFLMITITMIHKYVTPPVPLAYAARALCMQLKIETDPYYQKTRRPSRRSMSIPTYRRSSDVPDDSAAPPSLATSSRRSKRNLGPVKGEFFM